MTLNITLEKEFPNSQVEPVMIRLGPEGPVLWMQIVSTSAACIRLRFEEQDGGRQYDIVKQSILNNRSESK